MQHSSRELDYIERQFEEGATSLYTTDLEVAKYLAQRGYLVSHIYGTNNMKIYPPNTESTNMTKNKDIQSF